MTERFLPAAGIALLIAFGMAVVTPDCAWGATPKKRMATRPLGKPRKSQNSAAAAITEVSSSADGQRMIVRKSAAPAKAPAVAPKPAVTLVVHPITGEIREKRDLT